MTATPATPARVTRTGGGDYRVMRGAELIRNFGRRRADAQRLADRLNAEQPEQPTIDVPAADLNDGDVTYVTGRWQVLRDVRHAADGVTRARTDHGELFVGNPAARFVVRSCAGCGQRITVVDEDGDTYTECGGQGEGGCDAWADGDPASEAAHAAALAVAGV